MSEFVLSFKPAVGAFGTHDPSAAIFNDGKLLYGVEEERLNRRKHAKGDFPSNAIRDCLDHCNIRINDLERIVLPYDPKLQTNILSQKLKQAITSGGSIIESAYNLNEAVKNIGIARFYPTKEVERELRSEFQEPLPPIEMRAHHACHAASAFHPSGLDEALVLTVDGRGEYDSTVVWKATQEGIQRVRTFDFPNSIGHFFGIVTEFLGYRAFNGEGKIMGLAPYGNENPEIESQLRDLVDIRADYDVTPLTKRGDITRGVEILEDALGRDRKSKNDEFTQWDKDLAYVTQKLTEEIVVELTRAYTQDLGTSNVALSGGVALNCKMNKQIMELDCVDELFIQPVANDAGLAVGGGMVDHPPQNVPSMSTVYWGPEFANDEIESLLKTNKIEYTEPDDLERIVAERIADGKLVGWFQGRLEMGPRALGNRSILADPRTTESRDRVNKYVKHREEWRPFAPSILEEKADEYLLNTESSPYMIKTFDTAPEMRDEITAVLHPGDNTTRAQTVRQDQNPRYYQLISAFEDITGVPVLLNTSFNDHGEPIVTTPTEALKDFYGMGLDTLVLDNFVIEKNSGA